MRAAFSSEMSVHAFDGIGLNNRNASLTRVAVTAYRFSRCVCETVMGYFQRTHDSSRC